jgi:DNA helicase-2/ATP-dependent DNA helicase PcrA
VTSPLAPPLNDPQAQAAAHTRGPLLVFAGAGSGKTRVITYRVANLVAEARVPPYRIFAVTFTNKAAGEMRARLGTLLGDDLARDLWVGTFHATCAKLLRIHGAAIGLPRNFVIYDTDDQKAVVSRALRELDLDDKHYPPRACLAKIHHAKQELRGPDEMDADSYVDDAVVKVFRRYDAQLRAANAVDFEDLIGMVVRLLEENPGGEGDAIRRRFEYVLVDEFQDTNAAQYRFLRALTRDHRNLCVVGDDDQSIYRWRGADVRNIRGFQKDFPDAVVVKLEQNYRSTARIVRAALGVIETSKEREPKDLWTSNAEGAPIEIVATQDERDEAAYVVGVIQDARGRGVDPKEIAVFYRVHAQSRVIEEGLRAVQVPYQIIGGMRFYERAEIKSALAYLRVLINPRSDIDLLRVINTPPRGIGTTTLERLAALATARGLTLYEAIGSLEEAEPESAGPPSKRGGLASAKKRLVAVRDLLAGLAAKVSARTPSEMLVEVLETTGFLAALKAEDTAESEARMENLRELVTSIQDYEVEAAAGGEAASLAGYLERVTLVSDVDGLKDAPRVTLMTVHGAKGLEFEVVVLTGMEEDMFPYRGMSSREERDIEEERRLAYVAITRARSRLVMTHAGTRQIFGTTRYGRPSQFIAQIPKDSAVHKATRAAASRAPRFIDREAPQSRASREEWRHPFGGSPAAPPRPASMPPRAAGERFVDREFFDDGGAHDDASLPIRRGSRVIHDQYGEGEVREIVPANEPRVIVDFRVWGEKKILARFLRRA